jgi:DNA uptake protein ComE-like DNA-binding protein
MRAPRSFATLLVLVVLAMASIVIVAVQTSAYTEAMTGREALARVRAHWAARAGVEATIAALEFDTQNPDSSNAFAERDDMADAAEGVFKESLFRVSHTEEGKEILGPADAHAKLNVNLMTHDQLMTLPLMTDDIADAILDWIDPDDDTNPMGAEIGYYSSLPYPYEPRNAPMRSIEELELVAGVYPDMVRGEDTNLNGLLDPQENDGEASAPSDNSDGMLDAGWSGILTTASVDDVTGVSGQPLLDLKTAQDGDLMQRVGVDANQAKTILDYVANYQNAQMADFLTQSLNGLARRVGINPQQRQVGQPLTNDQLGSLFNECGIGVSSGGAPKPGKLNINTCPSDILQYLPDIDPALADSIIMERESRPNGFTSIMDLLAIPAMNRNSLAKIYPLLTVRSNVYVVTCRGRDLRTGLEVEMIATLDRSTLPVVIKDLRVR